MFGGKVQKTKYTGGVEHVEVETETINKLKFFEPMHEADSSTSSETENVTYGVSEFHSDEVVQIPKNFTLLASSPSCNVEGQISNDQRVLSFQFHPEYLAPFVKSYEERLMRYSGKEFFGDFEHTEEQQ